MAYNPFNWFRKNQKVLFAGLTILCMFVFILQFGRGDVFEMMLGWIGARAERSPTVVELHGKKVTEEDLARLGAQRRAASEFVVGAVSGNILAAASKLAEGAKDKGPDQGVREIAASIHRALQEIEKASAIVSNPRANRFDRETAMRELSQIQQFVLIQADGFLASLGNHVRDFKPAAKGEKEAAEERAEFYKLAERVGSLIGFLRWSFNPEARGSLYFGGNTSVDSLLDFLIWQHQADKLGITLTNDDVMREIEAEAAGAEVFDPKRRDFDNEPLVKQFVDQRRSGKKGPRITSAELLEAIRQEMRVAAAKAHFLGAGPEISMLAPRQGLTASDLFPVGAHAWKAAFNGAAFTSPGSGTPHEFLQFYRDQRTTMRVRLTPIRAEDFLTKVKAMPSARDLEGMFSLYKEREPSPASREPGFKEPRRVRAEYVVASPEDDYFSSRASEIVYGTPESRRREIAEAMKKDPKAAAGLKGGLIDVYSAGPRAGDVVLAGALSPLGAGPFGRAIAVATTVHADPVQANYAEFELTKRGWFDDSVPDPDSYLLNIALENAGKATLGSQALLATLSRAGLGSTAGLFALAAVPEGTATPGTALAVLATMEHRRPAKALQVALPLILSQAAPEAVLTAPALAWANLAKPIPRAALEPLYFAELQRRVAASLMMTNLAALAEKVEAYKGKSGPAPGELARAAKELHLKYFEMPSAMTSPGIIDALRRKQPTGLEALREAMERSGTVTPEQVARSLEEVQARFAPQQLLSRTIFGTFAPFSPSSLFDREPPGRPRLVLWLAEDFPPRLRSFGEAEELVREAWRLDQARGLARQMALDLAARVTEKKATPRDAEALMAEERAKDSRIGASFELEGVAQLIPPSRETLPLRRREYQPYQVPVAMADQMPYPPSDLVKQLLALKRPGDAVVVADAPARTFYVAVLEVRDEPSVAEMDRVYKEGLRADSLLGDFRFNKQVDYARGVMTQLRREAAGKVDAEGRFVLTEDQRKRMSGRQEDGGD